MVHELVQHTALASSAEAVKSELLPKFSPVRVIEEEPLPTELNSPYEATGASKEYPRACVPTLFPTERTIVFALFCVGFDMHASIVLDVHEVV